MRLPHTLLLAGLAAGFFSGPVGAQSTGPVLMIRAGSDCTVGVNGASFDMKAGETRQVDALVGTNLVQARRASDAMVSSYFVVDVKRGQSKSMSIRFHEPGSAAEAEPPDALELRRADLYRVKKMLVDADQLQERQNYRAAMATYGRVLKLNPNSAEAKAGLQAANKAEDLRLGRELGYEIVPLSDPGVKPPRVIYAPDPGYTDAARNAKYQGSVSIRIVVGADGHVKDARIQIPSEYGLDEKTLETVKQWLFQPATKDGKPVNTVVSVEVNFSLS